MAVDTMDKTGTITKQGEVTIPEELREKYGLLPGETVVFLEKNGELVLQVIDPDQAWYWTKEWQEGEREADEDIRMGRVSRVYDDVEEFIADLRRGPADD